METKGDELGWYSVWAQPSPTEEPSGLRPAMLHLRSLFQAPAFEPHVTVLGVGTQMFSLEQASLSLRTVCRTLPFFTCRLTRASCGNTFYQCVYMLVDPSRECHIHIRQQAPERSFPCQQAPHNSFHVNKP
ncbi:hypothetical protein L7F22_055666 [Adiantum nelumboides]|nr:hypothetical protein [Adiantum nelumboides]